VLDAAGFFSDDIEEILNWIKCPNFADKSQFVELPCKVGDTVYWYNMSGEITEAVIVKNGFIAKIECGFEYDVGYDEIGKTVFLTREEAEAALAERKNE
jgi:hypothetical protein